MEEEGSTKKLMEEKQQRKERAGKEEGGKEGKAEPERKEARGALLRGGEAK